MKKGFIYLSLIVLLVFNACKKEGSNNDNNVVSLPSGPQDTITSFMITFFNTLDSSNSVAEYADEDGPGPKSPTFGGFSLEKNTPYEVSFRIEDGTGVPIVLNNKIRTNGKDYKICINNPLGITVVPTDSDGSLPIGLIQNITTSSTTGDATMTFTIKYQKGVKNGQCEPGVVYFSCTLPFSVK
ncbi:MAG: hypothetical protein Q8K70_04670 [Bacteroidota bacterium]|nr:hypothetical protein [Bacteroidota bacterium]